MRSTNPPDRRRRRTIAAVIVLCLGLGSAAGLASGLVSCGAPPASTDPTRPLSADEAARLAAMRLHNFQDGRTGLRGTLGLPSESIQLSGWIDWQRTLTYLSVVGPRPGPADGLVQALPGIVAVRPGRVADTPDPPVDPPVDGWRIRPFGVTGPEGAPLDTLLLLLFTIATNQVDTADLLVRSDARWLRADAIDGVPVDVVLGPAVPPKPSAPADPPQPTAGPATPTAPTKPATPPTGPTGRAGPAGPTAEPTGRNAPPDNAGPATRPTGRAAPPGNAGPAFVGPHVSTAAAPRPGSLAAQGGAVTYWLDSDARLRRLEAVVGRNVPVRIDFHRTDRRELVAIGELGGRPVSPRRVTAAEADTLARLRQRDRVTGGGTFTLALPGEDANLVTATGWLDWRTATAYLAVQDTGTPAEQTLIRADRTGVTVLSGTNRTVDGRPPLPPPRGAWRRSTWDRRSDERGAGDLDLLVNEALSMAGPTLDSADLVRRNAVWLRTDTIGGTPVAVYEIPKAAERGMPPGAARMRYWVDSAGLLRRLELRGRSGGFGRIDLRLGEPVPYLPPVTST